MSNAQEVEQLVGDLALDGGRATSGPSQPAPLWLRSGLYPLPRDGPAPAVRDAEREHLAGRSLRAPAGGAATGAVRRES